MAMKSLLISCLMLLTACETTRVEYRPAEIDPTLLRPCPAPELQGQTNADVAILIVEYDGALACANGRIAAIAETISKQEGPE